MCGDRAKVAIRDASADVLLEEKAALEAQVADLLKQHERLSSDLPLRMQHVRPNPCCDRCS